MKKSSKQLESILATHMHATPVVPSLEVTVGTSQLQQASVQEKEKDVRISIQVPESLKLQFKKKMAEFPEETVRSIILRALKVYGFEVDEDQIKDKRMG